MPGCHEVRTEGDVHIDTAELFGIDPGHLLTATVMSAPAALVLAKMVVPETQESQTAGTVKLQVEKESVNIIDAAASGALVGLRLAANVGAMLLAFVPGVVMYRVLLPHLGRMRVPVFFYVSVISAMVWMAWEGLLQLGGYGPALAALGAVLFLFSDAALAWNRFRGEFRSADAIVLSTYYLSLFLIALSVSPALE